MDGHLKLFRYLSQYEDFIKSPDYLDPNVSWVLENDKVYYNYTPINNGDNGQVNPYESEYLTMELLEEGKLTFVGVLCKDVMYSIDNGNTWTEIDNGAESIMEGDISNLVYTPTFPAGTKVLWKSNIDKSLIGASPLEGIDVLGLFGSTCNYNLSGNIMSLMYGDDYATNSELNIDGVSLIMPFYGMFGMLNTMIHEDLGDTMSFPGVVDASELILPAKILADSCYCYMFGSCTSLTSAPELPATTLTNNCYQGMFAGCTSLTSAPELPATTLTQNCYSYMFGGCTSLTSAPELPATTLTQNCYSYMFEDCKSLTSAPALPATTLSGNCYLGMFRNCTRLTTAPELPASVLEDECYKLMFYDCAKLKEIKMYATDITATGCLSSWVEYVASTGTFYRNPEMDSLPIGTDGAPEGWTIIPPYDEIVGHLAFEAIEDGTFSFTNSSNDIKYRIEDGEWISLKNGTSTPTVSAGSKIYFKATNPSIAYDYGIGTFSSTGSFNASGNIMSMLYGDGFKGRVDLTGKYNAFRHLFGNCVGLVDASVLILPATTLADGCYVSMFNGCTSLISAPKLPATTLAKHCYQSMFSGCKGITTAPKLPATTLASGCYYNMFAYCTNLASAPVLPATTLADWCYVSMFQGCKSLTTAPALPATTLSSYCYYSMFQGCSNLNNITMLATDISADSCLLDWVDGVASTGTFTKHPDMNSLPTGTSGIPEGWTVVNYGEM